MQTSAVTHHLVLAHNILGLEELKSRESRTAPLPEVPGKEEHSLMHDAAGRMFPVVPATRHNGMWNVQQLRKQHCLLLIVSF